MYSVFFPPNRVTDPPPYQDGTLAPLGSAHDDRGGGHAPRPACRVGKFSVSQARGGKGLGCEGDSTFVAPRVADDLNESERAFCASGVAIFSRHFIVKASKQTEEQRTEQRLHNRYHVCFDIASLQFCFPPQTHPMMINQRIHFISLLGRGLIFISQRWSTTRKPVSSHTTRWWSL